VAGTLEAVAGWSWSRVTVGIPSPVRGGKVQRLWRLQRGSVLLQLELRVVGGERQLPDAAALTRCGSEA
jgi:hypothetical protein